MGLKLAEQELKQARPDPVLRKADDDQVVSYFFGKMRLELAEKNIPL